MILCQAIDICLTIFLKLLFCYYEHLEPYRPIFSSISRDFTLICTCKQPEGQFLYGYVEIIKLMKYDFGRS